MHDKQEKLGRWSGPVGAQFGGGDCHWILFKTGKVHLTNTARPIEPDQWKSQDFKNNVVHFDKNVRLTIGDDIKDKDVELEDWNPYKDINFEGGDCFDEEHVGEAEAMMPDVKDLPLAEHTPEALDEHAGAEVMFPHGSECIKGVVKARSKDLRNQPIGERNQNPLLDTQEYEVQMADGLTEKHGADLIAESILASVDDEGNLHTLTDETVDHKKNADALTTQQAMIETKSGTRMKLTTKGWELLMSWKDGTQSWVRLANMKESHPVETAQCALDDKPLDEPAFAWWAWKVLKKKERLLSKVKSKTKYWLKTHECGI